MQPSDNMYLPTKYSGFFILFFFIFYVAYGQGQFSDETLIAETDILSPRKNIRVDLNNDEILDVLVLGSSYGQLCYYMTDLEGNHGPKIEISQDILSGSDVEVADLDNDGLVDIITCQRTEAKIRWFRNLGNENFVEQNTIRNTFSENIHIDDIDNDGFLDVVTLSGSTQAIWIKNNGDGTFGTSKLITNQLKNPDDIYTADFDGDGDLDVLTHSVSDYHLAWHENDGNGNFINSTLLLPDFIGVGRAIANDIDSDGDFDIITSSSFKGTKVLKNNGTGIFNEEISLSVGGQDIYELKVEDMNKDGIKDIIVAGQYINIAYQNSDLSFNIETRVNQKSRHRLSLSITDINNDGHLDFTYSNFLNGVVGWLENDGANNFPQSHAISKSYDGLTDFVLNEHDIITSNYLFTASSSVDYIGFFNLTKAGYPFEKIDSILFNPWGFELYDFDSDGDEDIFCATSSGAIFYRNNGNFQFSKTIINSLPSTETILKDIDNDGVQDVLVVEKSSPTAFKRNISAYTYSSSPFGGGTFSKSILIQNIDNPQEMHLADINKDSLLDIFIKRSNRQIYFYTDSPGNIFSGAELVLSSDQDIREFEIVDLDNDQDIDLVVGLSGNNAIKWYENDGSNDFQFGQTIDNRIDWASGIRVDDIDLDGDLDILANVRFADERPGEIVWYSNDGQQSFSNSLTIYTDNIVGSSFHYKLFLFDQDGDDDKDLFAYRTAGDRLSFFENTGELDSVFSHIEGFVFWDQNENGRKEESELGLPLLSLNLDNNEQIFSGISGRYYANIEDGSHTLKPNLNFLWELTTDSAEYNFSSPFMESVDRNFGFKGVKDVLYVRPVVTSQRPRCNSRIKHTIILTNHGTQSSSGQLKYRVDKNSKLRPDAYPLPIEMSDSVFVWDVENLLPHQQILFTFSVRMPNEDFTGEVIGGQAIYEYEQIDYPVIFDHTRVLGCAFDPNSKEVSPVGIGEFNETLFADTILTYTINFENIGNDTAYTVELTDQLSEYLDWSTFTPIFSSPQEATSVVLDSNGLLSILFQEINLPGKNVDTVNNQGSFTYSIETLEELTENSLIQNFAAIRFDSNALIYTDTTLNNMVSNYSVSTDIINHGVTNITVFPNPTKGDLNVVWKESMADYLARIKIYDLEGQMQLLQFETKGDLIKSKIDLPSGFYFLSFHDRTDQLLGLSEIIIIMK